MQPNSRKDPKSADPAREKTEEERRNEAKRRANAEHGDTGTERQVGHGLEDRPPPKR